MHFRVIDTNTGKEPDIYKIAKKEEWAKDLIYCDMEGFFIGEEGDLILADECGNYVFCEENRFKIISDRPNNEPSRVIYIADGYYDGELVYDEAECPCCGLRFEYDERDWKFASYCMRCGQALSWETGSEDEE